MKLIAVISHKGGAGKTTSSVQIAEELARRGQRTLLVDADRQQGAGLLLGIDAPAGCVQRTTVPNLDYLGSVRLTDLEIADCYASVADRFDVGVVDTPSLDDALARAWLREASAALMVLQVDPLTVKTLPSALNTLEVVRAFKPSIQILGLLPTMFDQSEEAHARLLAELLSRRPDAVFTPVVPADAGLMHRANAEDCPPIAEAARQAYQCAVDRILRSLAVSAPSVALPHVGGQRPSWSARAEAPAAPATQPRPQPAPPQPANFGPPAAALNQSAAFGAAQPGGAGAAPIQAAMPTAMQPAGPVPVDYAPAQSNGGAGVPRTLPADPAADRALAELAARPAGSARRRRSGDGEMPEWWPGQEARIDSAGVARRPESWLVRSRFAIACTVACLALIAAVVLGTVRRGPAGTPPWGQAMAGTRTAGHAAGNDAAASKTVSGTSSHKKAAAEKHAHASGEASHTGKHRGNRND